MLNKRNYNKSLNNYDKQLMKQNNISSSLDDNKLILPDSIEVSSFDENVRDSFVSKQVKRENNKKSLKIKISSKPKFIKYGLRAGKKNEFLYKKKNNKSYSLLDDKGKNITLRCFLLVTPSYKEIVTYINENKNLINEILDDDLDIALIGYKNGIFNEKNFVDFIECMEEKSKWRWEDIPQIIIAKCKKENGEFILIDNKLLTFYIEQCIKIKFAKTIVDLLKKIKNYMYQAKSIDHFIKKMSNDYKDKKIVYMVKSSISYIVDIVSNNINIAQYYN